MDSRRALAMWFHLLLIACGVSLTVPAWAHIDLLEPEPRSHSPGEQKPAPCGGAAKTEPLEFTAGETIRVRWTETVPHPGWFVISFDPDGDDFDGDGDGTTDTPDLSDSITGNGDGSLVLLDRLEEQAPPMQRPSTEHETYLTLPETPCEDCTLQLIQVMDDRTTDYNYFRCVDVRLVAGDTTPAGGAGGTGGAAPMGGSAGVPGPAGAGGTPSQGGSGGTPSGEPTPDPTTQPDGAAGSSDAAGGAGGPDEDPLPGGPPAPTSPVVNPTTPNPSPPPAPTGSTGTPVSPSAPAPSATDMMTATNDGGDDGTCSVSRQNEGTFSLTWLSLLGLALLRRRRQN